MFPPIDKDSTFPYREQAVLRFWKERGIYEKSLAARDGAEPFVFYEGPPTANGMPHPGHCLTRAIKDLFPRFKTMRGYRCERKAGWDTHGLPVEVEVCKALTQELGRRIHSKEDIENYGVEPFIQLCQKSVWRYMQEWERLTERLGFWVDLDDAYVTYHQSYVESVWWSLKNLFDRGLLYQGHKIVWWWAQGGTALSAGEVGQGYRQVADPSVFVKFPIIVDEKATELGFDKNTSLLVWTTTPWTLPGNQFAAVNPTIKYVEVSNSENEEKLLVAAECAAYVVERKEKGSKKSGRVDTNQKSYFIGGPERCGRDLVDLRYMPPYTNYYNQTGVFGVLAGMEKTELGEREGRLLDTSEKNAGIQHQAWRVVAADFVTTESGTGIVHQAPAFGEVDYEVLIAERNRFHVGNRPELINCVAPDGKFTDEAPEFVRDHWVKDCDNTIIDDLKQRGLLFHREQYVHDYPFCWRAEEDPLIQYPRESWFIKTTEFKEQMLANNNAMNWLPEHIKGGRMGKFLESNVDWALSRERFWGTPLPIWICDETGQMEAVGSYGELLAKPQAEGFDVWEAAKRENPELPDDLQVHKPYIDAVTYASPFAEGARMRRVGEVIDCWYDSGAMPFAQWGYNPAKDGEDASEARERFESQFPADFISEAIDQTRGWFYSQLAISTMLFGDQSGVEPPHPFKNCIVLGLMLGEDGQKMSKSKRNYREPNEIFDKYGADALRWYLFANQPPWTSIRYSEQAIKDSIPEFLLRLWNVYSFFTIYANIDGWEPNADRGKGHGERGELDRWILSELHQTAATVVDRMDEYDNYNACGAITAFVDALSNWYVRRSRDRFWASDKQDPAKLDAYATLYECLLTTARMIAPFTPFLAEELWRKLAVEPQANDVPESVHLCDYPAGDAALVDKALSERMNLVRLISSLGRNARTSAELKVRQPLAKVEVILADAAHQNWLEEHRAVIADELNVKQVEFSDEPEKYVEYDVLPNFKLLGPKLGKNMPKVKQALAAADGGKLLAALKSDGRFTLPFDGGEVDLTDEEIEVRIKARDGWTAAADRGVVVVLATELTDELRDEGLARDLVRVIQDRRKGMGCEFVDRIEIGIVTQSVELQRAIEAHRDAIMPETLADSLVIEPLADAEPCNSSVGGHGFTLYLRVIVDNQLSR